MNKHEKILRNLFILARENEDSRFRLAAAVYKRNSLLAYGLNEMKTHTFQAQFSKNNESIFWHAENKAIFNSLKIIGDSKIGALDGCSIYIARAKLNGIGGIDIPGYCKPCDGCMRAVRVFGINDIYFTNDYDEIHGFSYTHLILDR